MQKSLTAIFLALAPVGALTLVPAVTAQAQQAEISVSLFHDQLAPHGRWFQHPRYGWAWFPTTVDEQWRPYSHGQWVWTEQYGWYWNSDEPFGWATYHYGRWGYDEVYGWVWIPGKTWGPAWVAFRYSDAHIGWAPLPPETLEVNFGFNTGNTDMSANYYEPRWVFVPRNRFLDTRVYSSAVPRTQNNIYIRQTVNVTNYVTVNNVIINRSIDRQRMETALGRRIEVARVKDVDDARKSGRRGDKEIDAYRPQVRVSPDTAPPTAARAKPGDKPRYTVQKDATPPDERRAATPAQPPTTPPGKPDEPRGATPAQPPATTPGTPGERRGATPAQPPASPPVKPDERRGATPAQPPATPPVKPDERRGATPAQPPATPPVKPDEPRGATPAQPPATPPGKPDERRGATPAQPPATTPGAPGERRGATPAQPAQPPAKVAPSAPPSQAKPQPPQRSVPSAKPGEPPKTGNDEKKKDETPAR